MTRPEKITPQRLLREYEHGRLTAHGFILKVLNFTGKQRLTRALEMLPPEILEQLKDFISRYEPGMRVFRGPPPRPQAIRLVRDWFRYATRSA